MADSSLGGMIYRDAILHGHEDYDIDHSKPYDVYKEDHQVTQNNTQKIAMVNTDSTQYRRDDYF